MVMLKDKEPRETMVTATQEELMDGTNGGCLGCGEIQYGGVEPDARKYECGKCEENQVYGLEQLLIMGRLILSSEE